MPGTQKNARNRNACILLIFWCKNTPFPTPPSPKGQFPLFPKSLDLGMKATILQPSPPSGHLHYALKTKINEKLAELNTFVTEGKENPPELIIFPEKSLSFRTAGDTSEGTACKNLVLYDLAILSLTDLPAVIHDSNMLHSISSDHFVKLSEIYGASGKQVFIATNRGDVPEIKKSAVLELSGGNVLFGHSWSKHSSNKI